MSDLVLELICALPRDKFEELLDMYRDYVLRRGCSRTSANVYVSLLRWMRERGEVYRGRRHVLSDFAAFLQQCGLLDELVKQYVKRISPRDRRYSLWELVDERFVEETLRQMRCLGVPSLKEVYRFFLGLWTIARGAAELGVPVEIYCTTDQYRSILVLKLFLARYDIYIVNERRGWVYLRKDVVRKLAELRPQEIMPELAKTLDEIRILLSR